MGAWSESVFGNDDAADLLLELEDADPDEISSLLEAALNAVLEDDDYVEAPEGAVGIAAAALVVAWKHPEVLNEEATEALGSAWPRTDKELPSELMTMSAAVLDRMQLERGNELAELWAEAGQASEYGSELRRWRSFLP